MINFANINPILTFILIVGAIITGGFASFFIMKAQLLKVTKSALEITQAELKTYKEKVDRLEKDIINLTQTLGVVKTENLSLITERDYLRGLIISAITSKKDIHKELLDEIKKVDGNTKLYRDGEKGGEG